MWDFRHAAGIRNVWGLEFVKHLVEEVSSKVSSLLSRWFQKYLEHRYLLSCILRIKMLSWQELSSCWNGRPFGHNIHGPKSRAAVPLFFGGGELDPHPTQCRLGQGLPLYQVASWSIQPFVHNRHESKIGVCAPFGGSWVPIKHNVARAEAYLHTKWHLDTYIHIYIHNKSYSSSHT